jgi:hypothetical protein
MFVYLLLLDVLFFILVTFILFIFEIIVNTDVYFDKLMNLVLLFYYEVIIIYFED